jgi:hypothetical protein
VLISELVEIGENKNRIGTGHGLEWPHYITINELPRSRAARYQKEFLLTPMQSIDEFF